MAASILLINGPNLNLLGTRQPQIYGTTTLADVESKLTSLANSSSWTCLPMSLSTFQSNHEGAIVDRIHAARTEKVQFIIINAGAYTHTSVALRDALIGVEVPFVEVHISNVHAREEFRHRSYLSDVAVGVIVGLGVFGYEAALMFAERYLKEKQDKLQSGAQA